MPGPWEKYGGQQAQGQGPWAKYGGGAPAPAVTPPPMPAAPIPQELQGPPSPPNQYWRPLLESMSDFGQDVQGAARRGTLSDQLRRDAQPIGRSADIVLGMGAGPRQLSQAITGAGKAAGFAAKYIPFSKWSQAGEATEGLVGSLAKRVAASSPELGETPLNVQRARVAQRFGSPTSGRSTGARPPRPDLIEQMGGKPVEDLANSDAAVKERMENSPEVTYGKYAKAHQGTGSRTYPEPDYFQEQGANRAPWGGNFPRQ